MSKKSGTTSGGTQGGAGSRPSGPATNSPTKGGTPHPPAKPPKGGK